MTNKRIVEQRPEPTETRPVPTAEPAHWLWAIIPALPILIFIAWVLVNSALFLLRK